MRYRQLTTEELTKAVIVIEVAFWLVVSLFSTLWWLPEYIGEEHPLTMRHGVIYFGILWVYFLNPITRYGFKSFYNGKGSYLPLKLRALLVSLSTIGFLIGLAL